jgi:hypothetical protein
MVKIEWVTKVTGDFNSADAVSSPDINTRTLGQFAYSHCVVSNTSGEDRILSFKDKDGTEAFTYTLPDGTHNLLWHTSSTGLPLWAFVVSSSSVTITALDNDGSFFVAVSKNGPIAFYSSDGVVSQTVEPHGGLTYQTLLAKYNSSGVFQWVIRMGSNQPINLPRLQLDFEEGTGQMPLKWSDGNTSTHKNVNKSFTERSLYVIGDYESNVTVIDTNNDSSIISGGSNTDMFLISFDSDGKRRWTAKMTGTDLEGVAAVDVYENHVYFTGVYKSNPLNLTPGTGSVKQFEGGFGEGIPVGYGITIALSTETGAYEWAVVFDAPADLNMITSQTHTSGVYIVGTIPGENVEIKDGENEVIGEIVSQEGALNGVFVVKMSHVGEYLWHVKINAEGTAFLMPEEIFGYHSGNILDSNGNVIIAAHYYGASEAPGIPQVFDKNDVLIGDYPQPENDLSSLSVLILKLTPEGGLSWITSVRPVANGGEFIFRQTRIDNSGNIVIIGNAFITPTLRLFNARTTNLSPPNTPVKTIDTFIANSFFKPVVLSYSNTGQYRWLAHLQYPDFEFEPFKKASETRMGRMNLFFHMIGNRLVVTPGGRVHLNLILLPGENRIYIENRIERTLFGELPPLGISLDMKKQIKALSSTANQPVTLSFDGSKTVAESRSSLGWVVFVIIGIIIIGLLMFLPGLEAFV